eukprot:9212657-Alexandrium_andersonii.AAC.1
MCGPPTGEVCTPTLPDTVAGAAAAAEAWLVAFGNGDAPEMRRAAGGSSSLGEAAGESSSAELSAGATVEPSEAPAAVAAASAATAA